MKTLNTQIYQVPEKYLEIQAQEIMARYCKSPDQIRKSREELEQTLQADMATDFSIEMMGEQGEFVLLLIFENKLGSNGDVNDHWGGDHPTCPLLYKSKTLTAFL